MGIIIVLCTVKIKLKTLESQGLAYHKHSIRGHYNYNFNYYVLRQCYIIHSLEQTDALLLLASTESHACEYSSPGLPFISLPLQQCLH